MSFLSLQPFVPSGPDYEKAKSFFMALGFELQWEAGGYAGLQKDGCGFILQKFDNAEFAANFMITVRITNAQEFYKEVKEKKLTELYKIRISEPMAQPYGMEVNIIDAAGVCWHFVQ